MYFYIYIFPKNIKHMFVVYLLFDCLHVDYGVTNASLFLCLFPKISAPVSTFKC